MQNFRAAIMAVLTVVATASLALGQTPARDAIPVTADNFNRAETDMHFALFVKRGAFGKFFHVRELPLEGTGVHPNRDTLYSEAVFDLDAGPVKITLPNAGRRFMSMTAINEDHYVFEVDYQPGSYTFAKSDLGTRYLFVALRIFVNPEDPKDIQQARALQDAAIVQQRSVGRFEIPNWDPTSHKKIRDAILVLDAGLPDLRKAFGTRFGVDPVRHLIATASAWGGDPDQDVIYLSSTPTKNNGATVYKLNVPAKVPVRAFWSVVVYDGTGHLRKNQYNAYSINSVTAKKSADGSVAIQFGGCDGKIPNCLPTTPDWNYMVRLYRPREEIQNGRWKFPSAQPLNQ